MIRIPFPGRLATAIALLISLLNDAGFSATSDASLVRAHEQEHLGRPIGSLKVDVNLVLVNATVTGPHHRLMRNLTAENFRIFEDKIEQKVVFFDHGEIPTSIGILLDVSGSMCLDMAFAKRTVLTLLRHSSHENEFFLVTFSDRPEMHLDFTSSSIEVERRIAFERGAGSTSLYDAIYLALGKMAEARYTRKVIVLITDGMENNSHYTFDEIYEATKQSGVEIYAVDVLNWESEKDDTARLNLTKIAMISGGKAYFRRFFYKLEDVFKEVELELENQYVLGYYSSSNKDGGWRKIKVEAREKPELSRLAVRAKAGYYAH
jgi:Ca-activated chloride channel family protein